ncbi:MAG TPA: hypothetical protein VFE24_08280 [Pirellulales bacterium]|jgi:hypothetical protein|nr:hypothetical protein [Pirellulales bacterium]
MPLKSFVTAKENVAKLKALRPLPPRLIGAPLRVLPRSIRYSLIGTAFDYLLRFEIKRRAGHAKSQPWAAAISLERLFRKVQQPDGSFRSLIPDELLAPFIPLVAEDSIDDLGDSVSLGCFFQMDAQGKATTIEVSIPITRGPSTSFHSSLDIAFRVGRRAFMIIEESRKRLAQYAEQKEVSRKDKEEMAKCSILLARIDLILRASILDPTMLLPPEPDDVSDLINLLEIVPFDTLLNQECLILNPSFGKSSGAIGGADTDLISGETLIDFKTTKQNSISVQSLDQLLGYYFLARNERLIDPNFPEITHLGLYFTRHGFLWKRPVSLWLENPKFAEVEMWFRTAARLNQTK